MLTNYTIEPSCDEAWSAMLSVRLGYSGEMGHVKTSRDDHDKQPWIHCGFSDRVQVGVQLLS